MTIENILGALSFYCYAVLHVCWPFLVGVFQWLRNLSKPTDQHVPFWKPFTDVVAFFKEPSTDLGWLPNLLFILPWQCLYSCMAASVHFCAYHGSSR